MATYTIRPSLYRTLFGSRDTFSSSSAPYPTDTGWGCEARDSGAGGTNYYQGLARFDTSSVSGTISSATIYLSLKTTSWMPYSGWGDPYLGRPTDGFTIRKRTITGTYSTDWRGGTSQISALPLVVASQFRGEGTGASYFDTYDAISISPANIDVSSTYDLGFYANSQVDGRAWDNPIDTYGWGLAIDAGELWHTTTDATKDVKLVIVAFTATPHTQEVMLV